MFTEKRKVFEKRNGCIKKDIQRYRGRKRKINKERKRWRMEDV